MDIIFNCSCQVLKRLDTFSFDKQNRGVSVGRCFHFSNQSFFFFIFFFFCLQTPQHQFQLIPFDSNIVSQQNPNELWYNFVLYIHSMYVWSKSNLLTNSVFSSSSTSASSSSSSAVTSSTMSSSTASASSSSVRSWALTSGPDGYNRILNYICIWKATLKSLINLLYGNNNFSVKTSRCSPEINQNLWISQIYYHRFNV